ncbi:hypothetical protein [Aridibaculum aurantiacum]|uniref:hypothetical protein n=1 Tax=Aridibaculum aurantiacum TaxID=2810307 RepID=UPI001A96D10D|nr:hypothetical protein [Aridibaculum aurantiacum]
MRQINKYHVYTCIYFMYRRIYRKSLLLFFGLLSLMCLHAQQNNLNGNWRGILFTDGDSTAYRINLSFNGNKLVSLTNDFGSKNWFKSKHLKCFTETAATTLSGIRRKDGHVRTDQYTITTVDPETASINWLRESKASDERGKKIKNNYSIVATGYIQKDMP